MNFLIRVIVTIFIDLFVLVWFGLVDMFCFVRCAYWQIRYGYGLEDFKEVDKDLGEATIKIFKASWELMKGNYEPMMNLEKDLK